MDSFRNILNTFFADVIALTGSWYLFYFVRFELGIIPGESAQAPIALFVPALVICVFWLIVFAIFWTVQKPVSDFTV